jgi:hypothetical protein
MYYIGLDVHKKTISYCVKDAAGHAVPTQGGVQINDYSAELGPAKIEVEVNGIGYPLYEKLFPGCHAEYLAGFRRKK